jgi:hypothetical protein
MTPDLSKSQKNAVQVNTSAGKLWLYPQRVKDLEVFASLPAEIGPLERLRSFLPCIAFRLASDAGDAADPSVDIAWCLYLSDEDLEHIAAAYLVSALFDNVAEDSTEALSDPRETAVERLDRLLTAAHARHREDARKASELFRQQFGAAFATLSDDTGKQFSPADQLAANSERDPQIALESASPSIDEDRGPAIAQQPEASSLGQDLPLFDDAPHFEIREPVGGSSPLHGEELDVTGARLDDASMNLSSDIPEIPTHVATELPPDAAGPVAASRWPLRIASAALALTILLAAVAVVFTLERYNDERRANEAMSKWQESISQMIKDSQTAQERRLQSLEEKLVELGTRQNALEASRVTAPPEAPPAKRTPTRATKNAKAKRGPKP